MPIINRNLIRKDVLELIDRRQHEQNRIIYEYFKKNPQEKSFYEKLWRKILALNEKHLKRKLPAENFHGILSYDEMLYIAKFFRYIEDALADMYQERVPIPKDFTLRPVNLGKFNGEWQIPSSYVDGRVILYIHGGGFILGSVNDHRILTVALAEKLQIKVLSIDYRLAPENNYPTHLNDCVYAYKWLLSEGINPQNILIAGDSAGGNLTLSTLLKLKQDHIPLPQGAICLSPVTDLSFTDEAFYMNAKTDPILADKGIFWWADAYIGDQNPRVPFLSPIFGDLKELPPLLIQASTCEMLYGDAERFVVAAKSAGVDVKFETWDDMLHVFQGFGLRRFPEAKEAMNNIKKFVAILFS
ncbi:MAG: steryl acetyl hydrolase [Promethearchaeota archaeon]|nr:MAG: steryl acetyl hydrolase [Candidatus Lokiarchaeota archaeon]